eukprot:3574890-Pleurochrysis_carterae.AAC.7
MGGAKRKSPDRRVRKFVEGRAGVTRGLLGIIEPRLRAREKCMHKHMHAFMEGNKDLPQMVLVNLELIMLATVLVAAKARQDRRATRRCDSSRVDEVHVVMCDSYAAAARPGACDLLGGRNGDAVLCLAVGQVDADRVPDLVRRRALDHLDRVALGLRRAHEAQDGLADGAELVEHRPRLQRQPQNC